MSGHPPVSILTLSILTFYHGRIFSWAHCHPEHRLHSLGCLIAISQTCPVWQILSNLSESVLQEIHEKKSLLYAFPIVIHSSLNPIP